MINFAKKNMKKALILSVIFTSLLTADLALAASGGAHHTPSFSDLTWYLINFFVFFGALHLILRKKMLAAWAARSERIQGEVQKGEIALAQAKQQLAELEIKMQKLPQELEQIKAHGRQSGANEVALMIKTAEEEKEKIKQNANKLIAAERAAFERGVRIELAEHVYAEAEKRVVASQNKEADQQRRSAVLQNYLVADKN